MTRPLKVAADPTQSPVRYLAALLQPAAWRDGIQGTPYQAAVLGAWQRDGIDRVQLTGEADADVAVLPFGLEAVDEHPELWDVALELARRADRHGLTMLVFCHGDRHIPPPSESCVMLRTSLSHSTMTPRDVPLPAWVQDPQEVVPASWTPYQDVPSVSFQGQAYPLGQAFSSPVHAAAKWTKFLIRSAAGGLQVENALGIPAADPVRPWAVHALRRSSGIRANVDVRPAMVRLDLDLAEDRLVHRAFLERIQASDYGLAVRGLGNYSYRLYEILAAGRMAVLVQTDMPLPRGQCVPWEQICLEVPLRSSRHLGRAIATHHRALGEESWRERQELSRASWQRYLSAPGFLGDLTQTVVDLADRLGPRGLTPAVVADGLR